MEKINVFFKPFLTIWAMLFLFACQTYLPKGNSNKILDPRFPYREHNITVLTDSMQANTALSGKVLGQVATKPKVLMDSFVKSYRGVSDKSPYKRDKPYFYDDYSRDVLADMGKKLMEPIEGSQMSYPQAIRAPYIVGGREIELSKEAILYKEHLDKVASFIAQAEDYLLNNQYTEALVKVNQALDLDPSSDAARSVYSKIVRRQARGYYEKELVEEKKQVQEEQRAEEAKELRKEKARKARMIEEFAQKITRSLQMQDFEEAKRLADIVRQIDPENSLAKKISDEVDLVIFKRELDPRIITNDIFMEDVILEHLRRYQEYDATGLRDLARRELQKITFLESLKK